MSKLIIERTFAADPNTVYEFITKTEHLLKWWGPEGMTIPEHNLDFSRPGKWVSVMANSDGKRYKVSGEVININPPRSVEFTWGWHDEEDVRGHESNVRLEVRKCEKGGSLFIITHQELPDKESADNHKQGWTSSLKKLERLAEKAHSRSNEDA